ncbi:MAG TPA: ester cyclase [Thermomicrobiales bacterium]|nr:ester cyclase [Thermomicrobiales bacterium]
MRRLPVSFALRSLALLLSLLPLAPFLPGRSAAAQAATPAATACPPTSVADNEALVQRYWDEGWRKGGEAVLRDVMSADEVHHWGIGDDTRGIDPYLARFDAFVAAFPDIKITTDHVFGEGDLVASHWTGTATHQASWLGIAPTGKAVTWTGANIFRIVCGKIVESWGAADHIALLQQLGALGGSATATMTSPMAAASPMASASPAACAPMSLDDEVAIARRWTEDVLNNGDLAALDQMVAPDAVHHGAVFVDEHGPAEVKAALGALLTAFPDIQFSVDLVVAKDDMAAIRWTGRGTHEATFMGVAPTNRPIEFSGINIYRFACGQIVEGWSEADGLGLLEQLGGGPAQTLPEGTPAAG